MYGPNLDIAWSSEVHLQHENLVTNHVVILYIMKGLNFSIAGLWKAILFKIEEN